MKPSVLFVHSNAELYGADFILLQVVCALREWITPIVALPGEGDLTERLRQEGIQVVITRDSVLRRVNFKPQKLPAFLYHLCQDVRALIRLIRQYNVRLVYSNTGAVVTGALAARWCHIPNLYHVHEIIVHPRWLARTIARLVLGNSAEVIAVSQAVKDNLLQYGRAGDPNIRVIHNGLDPTPFDREMDVLEVRREMGADPDQVLFGVIGRIHPWKGQFYFVEAARLVADVFPNARFVIIGGTFAGYEHLLSVLKARISKLELEPFLRVLPYRQDVPRLMRALDVFVLPSTLPDPLPTVVLEAMASERPVIATAHGGAPEMVLHGQTGLLISPHDPVAFAEAMLQLAKDPQQQRSMGSAGRLRLEHSFTLERFHRQIGDCVCANLQFEIAKTTEPYNPNY
ncbi:MAG: glycosyltransferase family 4 protein [bacterium]